MLVKANAMSAGGEIQTDIWRSQFPPSIDPTRVNIVVEKCKDQTGGDACSTAYNIMKCTYETIKAN